MAAEYGDKTEAPSPRRRSEARERGQVARSQDLTAAILLLGAMLALKSFGPSLVEALLEAMRSLLDVAVGVDEAGDDLPRLAGQIAISLAAAAGPFLLVITLVAVGASLVQVGPLFTTHPLQPTLSKINPLAGFGRLFSARSAIHLAINLAKLAVIGTVAYQVIRDEVPRILAASELDMWELLATGADATFWLGIKLGLVLLALALIDYLAQWWHHERDLRMTKEEVKEELRRMEGDPLLKHRRRQIQLQLAAQRLRQDVPKADVVVTNPTELAIALRYDEAAMRAPVVVAKGAGYLAQRIREIAALHQIPIIERKPLAQALYKLVEVGREIPPQLYQAVAEILAYVYEIGKKRRRRHAG